MLDSDSFTNTHMYVNLRQIAMKILRSIHSFTKEVSLYPRYTLWILDYLDDSNMPVSDPATKALTEAACGRLNGRTSCYYIPKEN